MYLERQAILLKKYQLTQLCFNHFHAQAVPQDQFRQDWERDPESVFLKLRVMRVCSMAEKGQVDWLPSGGSCSEIVPLQPSGLMNPLQVAFRSQKAGFLLSVLRECVTWCQLEAPVQTVLKP